MTHAGAVLSLAGLSLRRGHRVGPRFSRTWLAFTLAGTVAGLTAALSVLLGARTGNGAARFPSAASRPPAAGRAERAVPRVAGRGGRAGAVYAREYWSDQHYPGSAPRGGRGGARWC